MLDCELVKTMRLSVTGRGVSLPSLGWAVRSLLHLSVTISKGILSRFPPGRSRCDQPVLSYCSSAAAVDEVEPRQPPPPKKAGGPPRHFLSESPAGKIRVGMLTVVA